MTAAPVSSAECSYSYFGVEEELDKSDDTQSQLISNVFRQRAPSLSLEEPEVIAAFESDRLFKQLFQVNEICFYDYLPELNDFNYSYQSTLELVRILDFPSLQVPLIKGENKQGCRYVYFRVEIPLISKSIISIFNTHENPTTWTVSERVYEGVLLMEKDIVLIDDGKVCDLNCYAKYQGIFKRFFQPRII